jgi:titin
VSAVNDIGRSQWSQPLAANTAAAAPCRPTHVSGAAQSASSVLVSWQPPEVDNGAPVTTYHLEVQAATGPWTHVWQGKELSHAVGGLQPGRTYSWRVRGINSCGPGPWSEAVSAATAPAVPDAPGKPSVSKVAATSAKVKWNIPLEDHGAPVKAYAVQLRHAKAGSTAAAAAGDGSSSETESEGSAGDVEWQEVYSGPLLEHTVTKLQPGSSYEVRVAAANSVGQGRWSSAVGLSTPLRPPPPPADLDAVPDEAQLGSVAVTWQQPAGAGADSAAVVSVYLEASAPGSKEAAAKATVSVAEGCRAVLQGLRPGATYHIRARSVGAGGSGHSQYCDAASVVLPAPLVAAEEAEGAGALVPVEAGELDKQTALVR